MNRKVINNYANTLFDVAADISERKVILEELGAIQKVIAAEDSVQDYLYSSVVSNSDKVKLLNKTLETISLNKISSNFIKVLAKNNRMDYLSGIISALQGLIEKDNQEKKALVKYAREFSDSDQKKIKKFLEEKYSKKFILSFEKDEKLVAGVVISFDNIVVDASVRGILHDLTEQLDDAYLQSIN